MIVQLKRFFELIDGDSVFRAQIDKGHLPDSVKKRLKDIGVEFDICEVSLIWQAPARFVTFIGVCLKDSQKDTFDIAAAKIESYPLLKLWGRFVQKREAMYRRARKDRFIPSDNTRFNEWRIRRIAAVKSELGFFGAFLENPILSFELGDGCSVGCPFCAFAARKLTQNFDYTLHKNDFKKIVSDCIDLFGKPACNMAMLYFGTEPHDNPHYKNFLKSYTQLTGAPVFTSTAVTTDVKWLRELIKYYRQFQYFGLRLSILSEAALIKIHNSFTPAELRDVELLMQMPDTGRKKVNSGHLFKKQKKIENQPAPHVGTAVPRGSIECMSGFLINLAKQTIQLISPCYASEQWPYGYRVFAEACYHDTQNFRSSLEKLIDHHMPNLPAVNYPLQFRDDLEYRSTANGFDLISSNQVHHFSGNHLYIKLGSLISLGTLLPDQLMDKMDNKTNPMTVMAIVKKLFDHGVLNEIGTI